MLVREGRSRLRLHGPETIVFQLFVGVQDDRAARCEEGERERIVGGLKGKVHIDVLVPFLDSFTRTRFGSPVPSRRR